MARKTKHGLTGAQQKFADEWLIDHNGTRAYKAAYSRVKKDTVAAANAYRTLRNAKVEAYIKMRQEEAAAKYKLTQERVLQEEARIALFNPKDLFRADGSIRPFTDLPEDVARAVSSVEVKSVIDMETGEAKPATILKLRLWDKGRSLERVSKHLGLYEKDNQQKRPSLEEAFAALAAVAPELARAAKAELEKRIANQ